MNKLVLLLIVLCTVHFTYAQEENFTEDTPIHEQIENALSNLDLSEITSNLLYEKGNSYYNWNLLNGDLLHDSLALGAEHWIWLYAQTASSHIQDDENFPEPTYFKEAKKNWSEGQPIPIASLHFQYHHFREDAIAQNLISFDNSNKTFHDVPNRPSSPYVKDEFFIALPLIQKAQGTSQTFVLDPQLQISNLANPDLIEIDFGFGYQTVNYNQPITINFPALGEQIITIKFTLDTGNIIYAKTKIDIESANSLQGNPSNNFASGGNTGYSDAPDENNTEIDGLELNIFYNCQNGEEPKLLKPLILIEGFDPPQIDNINTWETMFDRLNFSGIESEFNIITTPSGNTLWQEFYNEGYDFIYVDFQENGAASIFENGDRVRELIEWINEKKELNSSNESNVIIGTSMGGLVGYWAMRNMEVEGVDHETEYLITFDTPFRGMNICLGFQHFIKELGTQPTPLGIVQDDVPALESTAAVLNTPAFQQMAYYSAYLPVNPSTGNSFMHDDFYEEFHGLGELEAKHVAISNGSGIGENQLLQQGEQYLKIEGSESSLFGAFKIRYSEVYAMNSADANWKTIYKHNIKVRILTEIFLFEVNIKSEDSQINTYDSGAGGSQDFGIGSALSSIGGPFMLTHIANNGVFGHSPIASALNIPGDPNPMTFSMDACENSIYRCNFSIDNSVVSPFTMVGEHNQAHVSFNSRNATFILNILKDSSNETDINPLTNQIYNFGTSNEVSETGISLENFSFSATDNIINYNFSINNQGQVWVNRSGKIDFTDNIANLENATTTNFELFINKDECSEESTTVEVSNGGKFIVGEWGNNIGNTAEVTIGNGGTLLIGNEGKLIANRNSRIIVKNGGTLHIQPNGILRAMNNAAITIEDGGQLILDQNANIQLWHNGGNESTIHIKEAGELVINGDINFSGTGFFQFDAGNTLIVNSPTLNFDGHNNQTRFIRLNQNAELLIPNQVNLSIQNAKIVYQGSSKIVASDCDIETHYVKFESEDTQNKGEAGIEGTGINKLGVYTSGFNNLFAGLKMNSIASLAEIKWSKFNGNHIGVRIENAPSYVRINECQFENANNSYAAIYLKNCGMHIRIVDSQINGSDEDYSGSNSNPVNFSDEIQPNTGIRLKDVLNVSMINSSINTCSIGINGQEDEEDDTITKNNITMFNGSTIQDCAVGIRINGQRFINEPFLDFGSVFMDCARLLNNRVGIQGTDILLLIDALDNAGNETPRANAFTKPKKTDLFFDICLETRADDYINDGLSSKGNYWSHLPNFLSIPPHYSFKENCLSGGSNLEIHYSDFLTTIPKKCNGDSAPQHPDDDNQTEYIDANCPELIVNTSKKSLHGAYYMLYGDWNASLISLDSVAKISEAMRIVADRRCKAAIDFARTYIPKEIGTSNYIQQENQNNTEINRGKENIIIQDMDMNFILSPNPTNGISNLKIPLGNYHLSVFSVLGQLVQENTLTKQTEINLTNKTTGIYFLKIKNLTNGKTKTIKLLKI